MKTNRHLARHNASNNHRGKKDGTPKCNCQKSRKSECPLPGECNQKGVIYQAEVDIKDKEPEYCIGLAKGLKTRWRKHRDTLKDRSMDGQTRFSKFVWEQRDKGFNPTWKWKILERNVSDFNPITGTCRLCTREKYRIVREPSSATLNHRTELFAYCKHKYAYIIGDPPDQFLVFFLVENYATLCILF